MGKKRSSSSKQPLNPNDEEAMRDRYPNLSFLVLGTPLTAEEKLARQLRGSASSRGTKRLSPSVPLSHQPETSPIRLDSDSSSEVEAEAIPAEPLNFSTEPNLTGPTSLPEGYTGPCWECVAKGSSLIADGQDHLADLTLGS